MIKYRTQLIKYRAKNIKINNTARPTIVYCLQLHYSFLEFLFIFLSFIFNLFLLILFKKLQKISHRLLQFLRTILNISK